jgi:hypothetical protein
MLFNKFKKQKNELPIDRGLYAFNYTRPGDFILKAESFEDYYEFMYFPGGNSFSLTKENFTSLIKSRELSFVEQLPEEIFKESYELFCCIKLKNKLHSA